MSDMELQIRECPICDAEIDEEADEYEGVTECPACQAELCWCEECSRFVLASKYVDYLGRCEECKASFINRQP